MTPTEFLALPDREKDASRYVLKCCAHCKKQFFALRRYVARGQMKHCSVACGQKASRRVHAIFHKGERFTLDKYGYYASSRGPACFDVIRPNFCKEILKSLTDQIKDSETWIEETKEYKDAVEFLK